MSTAQVKSAKNQPAAPVVDADEPMDFINVATDRFVYNAEACKEKALRGYLIDSIQFEGERPFKMFLIKLTAPTIVADRERNVHEAKVGDEVLIVATYALRTIEKLALNPHFVFEVWIKPINKETMEDGNSIWRYKIRVSKNPVARQQIAPQSMALPEGFDNTSLLQSGNHAPAAEATFP